MLLRGTKRSLSFINPGCAQGFDLRSRRSSQRWLCARKFCKRLARFENVSLVFLNLSDGLIIRALSRFSIILFKLLDHRLLLKVRIFPVVIDGESKVKKYNRSSVAPRPHNTLLLRL